MTKSAPVLFMKAPTAAGASQAQLEAGNYRKVKKRFQGLEISVENQKGSVRRGVDRDGHAWETKMHCDYGYIRGTLGVDKDSIDCYIGDDENAKFAYVIHQRKAGRWTEYDEDKVMLGFPSLAEAKRVYLQHYDNPKFLGPVTILPMTEFKEKARATLKRPAMIKALFLKANSRSPLRLSELKAASERAYPKPRDRLEFLSDRQTDKGPSSGEITETKVTSDGLYVKIRHSDEERLFSWDDLQATRGKNGTWMVKALR